MSKKVTFSNEQLCRAWKQVSTDGGNRMDVVKTIMVENEMEDTAENRTKMYNNVTQRFRVLSSKHGIVFPNLTAGKRGLMLLESTKQELQSLLS